MKRKEAIEKIFKELKEGMGLKKCHKCGCMQDTLKELLAFFTSPIRGRKVSQEEASRALYCG